MGTTQCVSGSVLHVAVGTNGITFLTFSQDHKTCPFTVVVFPDDLKKVGDIQQLEGRMVEIKGTIQDHDGRAEIVLRHTQQLGESAFVVVPVAPNRLPRRTSGPLQCGEIQPSQGQEHY